MVSDLNYNLLKKGLDVSNLRQKIISSNIANANTPNYKVNRVKFEEYIKKAVNGIPMTSTNKGHLNSSKNIIPNVVKRQTTYLNDNGNNVDIDLEMTELAANELYYATLIKQVNYKLNSLNYIINRS